MNDNQNLRDQRHSSDSLVGEARRADFLQIVQTGLVVLHQVPSNAADAHHRARSAAEHMGHAVARSRQIPVDQDVVAAAMTFLDEVLGTDAGDRPVNRRPAEREKFERTVPRWKEEIGADMLRIEALIREKPGCRSRDLKASAPHLDSYQMGWLFDQLIIRQKAYRDGTTWYPGADPRP